MKMYYDILVSYSGDEDRGPLAIPHTLRLQMWVKLIAADNEQDAARDALRHALHEKKLGAKVEKWRYSKRPKGMEKHDHILD